MLALRLWAVHALMSVASGSLTIDIIWAIQNAVDCESCHAALAPIQNLARLGDEVFVDTIVNICTGLGIEDADVCAGAIGDQGPILAHDLRQISIRGETATKLCDAVFGLCQPPPVNRLLVPFPKAAPVMPRTFKSTGKTPFQVAHFSDVHIDRHYTIGAEVNCTKPICCRNFPDLKGHRIRVPARPNGERFCDTPPSLADSMLTAIQQAAPSAKFSVFTGDVVEAAVWLLDQSEVTKDLQEFNDQMSATLGAPVFGVIGNHDSSPVNHFPRSTTLTSDAQWVFDVQSQGWRKWINSTSAYQLVHRSGSYSTVVPGTNLRIISVNTNYWYKQNFWLYDTESQQTDPNGILSFMIQELQGAEDAGQRAWLIGHSPPGKGDIMWDQSNYYDQIVQRYRHTIAGQFFGHTHVDELQIAYSDYENRTAANADSVAFIAPALTPRSGNPAFKVYDVDPDTLEVMDARVYYTNMSEPSFRTEPAWKLYYSARESYGPIVGNLTATDSLSPAFWHNLTEAMVRNDTVFNLYQSRKKRGVPFRACRGACKNTTICAMRSMRSENDCNRVTPGVPRKRDQVGARERVQCEGTGISHIMSKFLDNAWRTDLTEEEIMWA